MSYHSLIFDLDGTLSDPLTGILRCMNYALSSFDYQPVSEHEIKRFIGPPLEFALSELSGSKDDAHIAQLVATYRERYGELGYAENVVYPGVVELLTELKNSGYRMGVCTSKFEKYALKVLQNFELDGFFTFVSGSTAPGMSKADQLGALLISDTIEKNSLMIGDRDVDLSSARSNGLYCAGVLWGYGSREELAGHEPDFIAETPLQLADWILA